MTSASKLVLIVAIAAVCGSGAVYGQGKVNYQAPAPAPAPAGPVELRVSVPLFEPLDGLTMDMKQLLFELGYLDSPTSINCSPLTYRFCLEVAVKCHSQRRYADSRAFVRRAIAIRPTTSALYLQALDELALGLCDDAVVSLQRLRADDTVQVNYDWLREKLSSPLSVRANLILEAM